MNYPAQYPQQPQPGYAQQPYAPQAPAQPYQQPYQQPYAPQAFGQAPAMPPAQPLADGSIDAFYSQPNTGGGPGVSWKGKPDGYTVQGVVPRDVTNADVTQEVGAPNTQEAGRPQFYRDGRPKFVMAVPLQLAPSAEYPEGEARLFVRGQLRDELTRAMSEAGQSGAPKAGSVVTVTLVERKQGRGSIPQNVFRVVYTPPGGQGPTVQQPQQAAAPQAQQFAQAPQGQQPQQFAPQQPAPQYAQQGAPMTQNAGQPPAWAQPAQQQAPQYAQQPETQQHQAPAQGAPQPPTGMTPEQQALIAQIAGNPGSTAA